MNKITSGERAALMIGACIIWGSVVGTVVEALNEKN